MATLALSDISAVLNLIYGDQMADQIRRDVVLPQLVEVAPDRNSTCTWRAKFTARTAGGPYSEGADMADADFDSEDRAQATLAWAEYRAGAKVSGLSHAINALNGGTGEVGGGDLLTEEIIDAIDKISRDISTDTYAGNVTLVPTEIEGLARAVDSTGTYAGLAQVTYAEWASGESSVASAALSLDVLRTDLHRLFHDGCGMWPEFVVTTPVLWDRVGALFGAERRYLTEVTTQAKGKVVLSGGFRAIEVDGIPYIEDRHCTANTFYALHSSSVSYRQVPAARVALDPTAAIAAIKALTGTTLEKEQVMEQLVRGERRLQPTIEMLGKTGDNLKAMVKVYAQLRLRYRNRAAKLLVT